MGINFKNSRILGMLAIVAVALLLLGGKLINVQLVQHDTLLKKSKITNSFTVSIPSTRGEIVDRNGNPLVVNTKGNSIVLDWAAFPPASDDTSRNAVLYNLIVLFENHKQPWENNLPLELNGETVSFKADSEKDIAKMKSAEILDLATYATAQNCFDALLSKYKIAEYSVADSFKIATLRYELSLKGFSGNTPIKIADNVSDEVALIIKEQNAQYYRGADIQITAYRSYVDGTVAPHILGTTTKMTAELYTELKSQGYGMNDMVGESGIEKAMESYLRGTNGQMTVTIDDDGKITKEVTKQPVQGCTIVLTIDKNLQIVAQDNLAATVVATAPDSAGAVVVQEVNTGEILAAASYPTFDISKYRENYQQYSADPMLPLWNRFSQGTYAPGSTFKPNTAIASLETGTIDANTTFVCHGYMTYKDRVVQCQNGKSHGTVNVEKALEQSCNIFFYNCADQMGIQKMNEYSSDLGFGQKTGVEITEAKGIMAGKAYRESHNLIWQPGDTLQAAIGQGDNLVTPLQLASYCATVANGGTRYQSHFVKQILSYDCSEVVSSFLPTILEKLDVSQQTIKLVHNGMDRVTRSGAPAYIFKQAVVPTSAKTGTSQVANPDGTFRNNGFLIAYAPSENPELAISSVIELAGSGTQTASITKEIINAYYATNEYSAKPQGYLENLK